MLRIRRIRFPVPFAVATASSAEPPVAHGAPCVNCACETPGRYCPRCGQERRNRLVSLPALAADFLEDEMALSSRLPVTVLFLLARPGFLTREYLRGRIVRYIRPLKLYLGTSVIFFLLVSVLDSDWLNVGLDEPGASAPAPAPAGAEEAPVVAADASPAAAVEGGAPGPGEKSWVDEIEVSVPNPLLKHLLEEKRAHFRRMTPGEAFREVMKEFREHVPTMMFVLLPVFALLLKLLYARRGRLYVEHFVFALHLHAFAFATFGVMLLARNSTVVGVLVLWVLLYTFLAMRRVYGQSLLKTGVKYLALGWTYSLVMTVAAAITAVITVLLV
ncbi:MAG TPA: DUF3667 domain-containing protein [Longimicrobiaceae bacterium]|nr:DUF3667 domain-containing protein [Longimicrobiaceae bacterium]